MCLLAEKRLVCLQILAKYVLKLSESGLLSELFALKQFKEIIFLVNANYHVKVLYTYYLCFNWNK